MADTELGELFGPVAQRRVAVTAWIGLIGALTSAAMVVGIGVWGYKLLMRDVNGIPVVLALEGPMRVAPKDPGGERMAHQGLAVNQVAAEGAAGDIADQLTLAPPAPALLDLDLPKAQLGDFVVPDFSAATNQVVAEVIDDAAAAEADDAALVDAGAAPPQPAALLLTAAPVPVKTIATTIPGVKASPRPAWRPAALVQVAAVIARAGAPAPVPEAVEIQAETLPVGSRLVQLGAFETPDLARQEWGRMAVRFSEVMAGKMRVIQEATSGGQTFFRLRVAGFSDLADARRFCATLSADKTKPLCVPVATR